MKQIVKSISWRLLKIILGFTEFIAASVILYLTLAILFSIISIGGDNEINGVKIYIKTNGVHTDICLPVKHADKNWTEFIPLADFPKVKDPTYISIGWGDKGFFLDTPTWDDLTFSTAFKAAFLPSETAMHVQYLSKEPQVSTTTKQKFISEIKYRSLCDFITDSFKPSVDKNVMLIPFKGYWSDDNFYEAQGSYHLFNTCNAWTNRALKIAGVKTSLLALFSDGIMRHLDD